MSNRFFLVAVTIVVLFAGCSTAAKLESALGNKYRFRYVLLSPSSGMRMSFSDEQIKILFRIDQGAVRFKLINRTQRPVRILWENVTLGVRGSVHAARSSRSLYLDDPTDDASPEILPGQYLVDLAIPARNVYFDGSKWRERDLLPTTDRHSDVRGRRIRNLKGSKVSLRLPLVFGDELKEYQFEFVVTAVERLEWERYRRPWRPAPPPTRPVQVKKESGGQLVTAIVIAGLLGISAVLLTQKKDPPSE